MFVDKGQRGRAVPRGCLIHSVSIKDDSVGISSDEGRSSDDVFAAITAPEFYQQNPFRQTGLSVLAGTRACKRLDALRQTLELGTAECRWAFAPGLAPSARATDRCGPDAERSATTFCLRVFWFWPESYPEGIRGRGRSCLAKREVEAALEYWRRAEAVSAVAAHNLAVYYHLQALGGEQVWSAVDKTRRIVWAEAFARWHALEQNADLWARVESRLRELDESQLPLSIVGGLQAALPRVLATINAGLLVRYAQRDDIARANNSTRSMSGPRTARACSRCAPVPGGATGHSAHRGGARR